MSGCDVRLRHVFQGDGRAVVVALDHGIDGVELPKPEKLLKEIVEGGADATIMTYGWANRYGHLLGRCGLFLSITTEEKDKESCVLRALRIGAEGIKCITFSHKQDQGFALTDTMRLAGVCREWNLALMTEMVPVSFEDKKAHTPKNIAEAAHMGVAVGGDILKLHYTGSKETFQPITDGVCLPILVLGGPRSNNVRDFFTSIKDAIDAGASGVAIGRNVWGHQNPGRMASALSVIVHQNATVDQAMKELEFTPR
jgi:DhnA family fructose-bisphosphate aldolase class Ia